jgi:hypothetical protein
MRACVACIVFVATGCAGNATGDNAATFVTSSGHEVIVAVARAEAFPLSTAPPDEGTALLAFVASGQFNPLVQVAGPVAPFIEKNIIHLFRNNGPQFVLPDIGIGCAPNQSCLGSAPPLTLFTTITVGDTTAPVLITGKTRVSSELVPRSGDLPRTDWSFTEPVTDLHWTGRVTTSSNDTLIFTASLAHPATPLAAMERTDITRSLADFISTNLRE